MHRDATRVVVGDQSKGAGAVDGDVDRPCLQWDGLAVRAQRAAVEADAEGVDVVAVAWAGWAAVAGCDVQDAERGVPPSILHIGGQRDLGEPREHRGRDIRPVGSEYGADALVESDRPAVLCRNGLSNDRTQRKSHGSATSDHWLIPPAYSCPNTMTLAR